MLTVLGQWRLWRLRVFGITLSFWAENLALNGRSCWSESSFSQWSGVNSTCSRNGECRMGCNCACCYHSMKDNWSIHWLKGSMVAGRRARNVPSKAAASVMARLGVGP